jgi:uncharacterized membrane protein
MKVFLILILTLSCNYKIEKQKRDITVQPTEVMLQTVSFKQVKEEVFLPKCISCHGNAGGVSLESYSSALKHIEEIKRSTLQIKSMPKAPVTPLNDRQLEVLTAWLEAGGPEVAIGQQNPENDNADDGNDVSQDFAVIKKEIIDTKCLSCHRSGEHAGHIPLETREDLLSSPLDLVVPERPGDSLIYTITAPGARNMMPPLGVEPLTDLQREMIKAWILRGAP